MLKHDWRKNQKVRNASLSAMCMLAAWLGALPYVSHPALRLLLSASGGLLVGKSLVKWLASRQMIFTLEQFQHLLGHILERMTAGSTIEKAFIDAPKSLEPLLGKKSALLLSLRGLERQLSSHQPLDRHLDKLGDSLPCPEVTVFLKTLPDLRNSGASIVQYIRQNLRMIMEKINLCREIGAETTQRRTEALVLAFIPFGLTVMLQKTTGLYEEQAGSGIVFSAGMALAYALAVVAAAVLLSFLGHQAGWGKKRYLTDAPKRPGKFLLKSGKMLHRLYPCFLPESYVARLFQSFQEQPMPGESRGRSMIESYFRQKSIYLIAGLFIGIPMSVLLPGQVWWIAVFPVSLCFFQDIQAHMAEQNRQLRYRMEYPSLINHVTALLQAGLSLHAALAAALDALSRDQGPIGKEDCGTLGRDLKEIGSYLKLGLPAGQIIEKLSLSCPVPEIQAALLLLVRYERAGGQEILDLLQIQSAACWNLCRQAMRRQMEQQSVKLILPMMLDLVSVMVTAVLPVWSSFRSF